MIALSRPASLRGRAVLGVLALLAVLLVALFVAVDLTLGARLRADLRTRLTDRVALAEQLDSALTPQQLVDRLTGDGVQVSLCTPSSTSSGDRRCVSPQVAPAARPRRPGPGGPPGQAASPAAPAPTPAAPAAIVRSGSTLYVRTTLPRSGQQLALSVDSADVDDTVHGLVLAEIVGGLLMLAVAALLLGRVVGVALRPLDEMTGLARRIAGGDRGRRLDVRNRDTELGRTAAAFDDMLDELESAVRAADDARDRLRQFLGDASHELRSPLAGLQARAEQLLRDEPARAEREQVYVSMVRETQRANRLVEDLLTVARDDGGPADLQLAVVDLVEVAHDEVERTRVRARGVSFLVDGVPHALVRGDRQRLAQILGNLLDNAVRAVGPTGSVHVRIGSRSPSPPQEAQPDPGGGPLGAAPAALAQWSVDVCDDGPGIPDADRDRIFDRLVRLDASRTRDTGGSGLGLPIARALARAHGGTLDCLPSAVGAHFRLVLPQA